MALLAVAALLCTGPVVTRPAGADGPAACTAGSPPFPYRGFCGTYNGANTYYGSYGLGFPTPTGWGICAFRPGGGGAYPAPGYSYQLASAPSGADESFLPALGYAYSRGLAEGFFDGSPGAFTADQAAVAAKLLYDQVAWHIGSPGMDAGVQAAFTRLLGWMTSAQGATGPPSISVGLQGGGSTFPVSGTIRTTVAFPGSGRGVEGVSVLVGLSNATFDGSAGATSALGTTNASGVLRQAITATGTGPITVTVTAVAKVGEPGALFYRPTVIVPSAQWIVAPRNPILQTARATFSSAAPPPPTGTISVAKSGDDTAYFPITGAQFEIRDGSGVVDSLTVDSSGAAGPSTPLPIGTYTVHESLPPPGYLPAPDQTIVVTEGTDVLASFTGAAGDHIDQAGLELVKRSSTTGEPVAGAVISLAYDANDDGSYETALGSCTTDALGTCTLGSALLPGRYLATELSPPPGYAPDPHGPRHLFLSPGQRAVATFKDAPLVGLSARKVDAADLSHGVGGAVLDLYRMDAGSVPDPPAPPTSATTLGGGTWIERATTGPDGRVALGLVLPGFAYCVIEHRAPEGYAALDHPVCSEVLHGDLADPPTEVEITVADPRQTTTLSVQKTNAAEPGVGVPDATYDLYLDGHPPAGAPTPPKGAPVIPGKAWWAAGTTDQGGRLTFIIPTGFSWCTRERSAPSDFIVDPGLHCTAVIDAASPDPVRKVAVREVVDSVRITAFKFNASNPGTGIPGASYALFVRGAMPPGFESPTGPAGLVVPEGLSLFAIESSDARGQLGFDVPAGFAWCLLELSAPAGYLPDPGLHCTAVISHDPGQAAVEVALPELPAALAATGSSPPVGIALGLLAGGAGMLGFVAWRRRRARPGDPVA